MSDNRDGLDCILQAINNIVEPKVATLKYDKTYRAKVTQQIDTGLYMVQINNVEYKLPYSGTLNVGDIVKVKAPLNNFSDIYIEALPGSGGGGGGVATLGNDTKISDNQLPIATTTDLGVVKVGANLTIGEDGTLNALGGSGGTVSDTLPIGSVVKWFSTTIPTNWLECNGQAISRTEYAELFAVIGTKYGSGDGSTTFNLPNIKGKTTVGLDIDDTDFNTLGKTGGEKTHTLTENEIPPMDVHMTQHTWFDRGGLEAGGAVNRKVVAGGGTGGSPEFVIGTVNGGGQAHNNLQPYIVSNYIIKAKQTQAVAATVVDNLTSESSTDALSANQGRVLNEKITNLTTYSTEEVKTGETWIDGKPIYKKTIQFTTSATGKHSIKHNISGLDTIIDGKGSSKSSLGTFYIFPMSAAVDNVPAYSISIQDINTTYIYFFRGTSVTGTVTSYVTLYYTKTTD